MKQVKKLSNLNSLVDHNDILGKAARIQTNKITKIHIFKLNQKEPGKNLKKLNGANQPLKKV